MAQPPGSAHASCRTPATSPPCRQRPTNSTSPHGRYTAALLLKAPVTADSSRKSATPSPATSSPADSQFKKSPHASVTPKPPASPMHTPAGTASHPANIDDHTESPDNSDESR